MNDTVKSPAAPLQPWQHKLRIFFLSYPQYAVHLDRAAFPDTGEALWQTLIINEKDFSMARAYHYSEKHYAFTRLLRNTSTEASMQNIVPNLHRYRYLRFRANGELKVADVKQPGTWWPELRFP